MQRVQGADFHALPARRAADGRAVGPVDLALRQRLDGSRHACLCLAADRHDLHRCRYANAAGRPHLPLLWAGLLVNINGTFVPLQDAVIGAAAGYLALWAVYWAFKLATGKEGMGYGDFKLLAALGAWLGWTMLPTIILLSSLVGAVVGIGLIVFAKRGRDKPIPFGPYLAAAGLIALLYGTPLSRLTLGLTG